MNTLVLEPGRAVQAPTKTALSALRKILRKTELNSKALMRETGLTPSQLIFMQLLDDGLEHTAGSVAARMGITQATTTALIQKLEALNMVARRKGQTDRRQVWLSLTDKGRKVLEIAPDGAHAQFHDAFSSLEEWEQLMLIAALERVASMLDAEDDTAAAVLASDPVLAPRAESGA
ncbi:MAG TPA: MarR family transcriptional regulator [Pelagibacterium sp.]|jgi:MarR family transcriptional regulator, organic hydroperoxide resistance regulator|uniref:MarR family winged helix-turn-helix transcriptional regulator n=1 Tax=uncultured Pelagibacterium sp. TaxID=1159875 RepID=UPI000C5FD638|nr:MarR family transcriptional regulator [Pelagibacterium sp.]HCO56500.1 MarR family transcriptional regulator [Pelagibacterium sp.]|tara:strand:+ start:5388 stop:5915 length:528 start_codon:yes stop_codon:yes gene_type:complete